MSDRLPKQAEETHSFCKSEVSMHRFVRTATSDRSGCSDKSASGPTGSPQLRSLVVCLPLGGPSGAAGGHWRYCDGVYGLPSKYTERAGEDLWMSAKVIKRW